MDFYSYIMTRFIIELNYMIYLSFKKAFCLLLGCCIIGQFVLDLKLNSIDNHLSEYSRFSVSRHENIDEESHSHKQNHGKDGEEHEHKHEHTKITQSDAPFLNQHQEEYVQTDDYKSLCNFFENSLISNPHPQGIFRPPIA